MSGRHWKLTVRVMRPIRAGLVLMCVCLVATAPATYADSDGTVGRLGPDGVLLSSGGPSPMLYRVSTTTSAVTGSLDVRALLIRDSQKNGGEPNVYNPFSIVSCGPDTWFIATVQRPRGGARFLYRIHGNTDGSDTIDRIPLPASVGPYHSNLLERTARCSQAHGLIVSDSGGEVTLLFDAAMRLRGRFAGGYPVITSGGFATWQTSAGGHHRTDIVRRFSWGGGKQRVYPNQHQRQYDWNPPVAAGNSVYAMACPTRFSSCGHVGTLLQRVDRQKTSINWAHECRRISMAPACFSFGVQCGALATYTGAGAVTRITVTTRHTAPVAFGRPSSPDFQAQSTWALTGRSLREFQLCGKNAGKIITTLPLPDTVKRTGGLHTIGAYDDSRL